MKTFVYTLAILAAFALSCKESRKAANPNNDATKKVLTREDSAYKQALAYHDEVMPKMGKLIGYQKRAQHMVDSLDEFMMRARLTASGSKAVTDKKDSLNALIFDLKLSEKAMNDWMGQFEAEPKLATAEERTAYFQDQREKARVMHDRFFASLKRAQDMIGD